MVRRHWVGGLVLSGLTLVLSSPAQTDWPSFGNDPGAMRYSPLKQINTGNITQLKVAWKFDPEVADPIPAPVSPPLVDHSLVPEGVQTPPSTSSGQSGSTARPVRRSRGGSTESIPLVVGNVLYMSTGYRQIVALAAESGEKLWTYDSPHPPAPRGVSYWPGSGGLASQIVYGTSDGWLISLDAKTGKPTPTFGDSGMVDIKPGVVPDKYPKARASISSPLSFYKDYVITGSSPGEQPAFGALFAVVFTRPFEVIAAR